MSRLISQQLGQSARIDSGRDPQEISLHDGYMCGPNSSSATDQALALASHARAALTPEGPPVERQQNRPSVITCAPASFCSKSHSPVAHDNFPSHHSRPANMIEEHFRRSLGQSYAEAEPKADVLSVSGSVDEHFAKALGETWQHIKTKGSSSTESTL
ncbi:hypothetical protein SKAU_G00422630 [Synaphobranchus kaupii]|uniref:Transcription cofactor vestigial-like protein 4 n=1 Tax=Synaphobranchus kaupii TaxID=118154 RepID=A0A9Q1E724_SYNKA|nr:hypothetical protein SKAU_G00422630 [Synaphobranchus kaupii]